MKEQDFLDQNLAKLLAVAPQRERLSSSARARIRHTLDEARTPRLRLLPVFAAAAAVMLVSLGAWRWLPDSEARNGSVEPNPGGSPMANSDVPEGETSGDPTSAGAGPGTVTSEPPAGPGGREPLLAEVKPQGAAADEGGPDETVAAPDGRAMGTGVQGSELHVRATVAVLGQDESLVRRGDLPMTLTLWVKPVVQLPRVADPVAFQVPVTFSQEGAGPGLAAILWVDRALKTAQAMGTSQVLLQVEAPGFAPSRALVTMGEASAGSVRFALESGMSLTGYVLDAASGNPVPGAVVVAIDQLPLDALDVAVDPAESPLPRPFAIADALGRFRIEDVKATRTVRLRASAPGLAPTILSVSGNASPDAPLSIELTAGSSVVGLVERPDGTPWKGAQVILAKREADPASLDRGVMTFGSGACDRRGEFKIPGLPKGWYVALLFDPARPQSPLEFRQVHLDGASETRTDFRAPVALSGLTLKGTLTDVAGDPVQRSSLTLASLDEGFERNGEWRVTETDASGKFQFPGIQPAAYSIFLSSEGFEQMNVIWEGRVADSQDLGIMLPATELLLEASGADGDGTSWIILDRWQDEAAKWHYAGRAPTQFEDGHRVAHVPSLLPGRYRAVVLGPGHGATWTEPFELEIGRPAGSSLHLRPGGWLTVLALDAETGAPLAGLEVTVEDPEGRPVPQQEPVSTGPDGSAVIRAVPHGGVTVSLRDRADPGEPIWQETVEFDGSFHKVECRIERP